MTGGRATLIAAAALVCGAAAGWFLKPDAARGAPAPERRAARKAAPAGTTDADVKRLRARVKDLEKRLAEAARPAGAAAPPETAAEEPAAPRPDNPFLRERPRRPPTAAEMRAHLAELRAADPERYAQMTNGFAKMRSRMLTRTANRLDILASVDVSGMSDEERAVHDRLQDLIARREELGETLNPQNEDASEEERQKAFQEMRDLHRQMRALEEAERTTLLKQTASAFGLTGADAGELVDTVTAIYEATQGGGGHGGPPPGGPGGGGR